MQAHSTKYPSVSQLVAYMRRVGYAPGTIDQRARLLDALPCAPEHATRADVLDSLPMDARPSTKRVYVSSMSAGFRDLITLGLMDHNPALGVRIPGFHRGIPRPLPPTVVAQLCQADGPRERDWTVLGIYGGLRASDVAGLYRDDLVETEFGWALALEGKGGVRALVPAHELVCEVMRRGPERGPMWRVSPAFVSTSWAHWVRGLTGGTYRFHQCRHTFATRVFQAAGRDLLVTRDLMRHASVATTQVYTSIAVDDGYRAVSGL